MSNIINEYFGSKKHKQNTTDFLQYNYGSVAVAMDPFEEDYIECLDHNKVNYYKIHHDGGHYVGVPARPKTTRQSFSDDLKLCMKNEELDSVFDSLYFTASQQGLQKQSLFDFIKQGILSVFETVPNLDNYITNRIKGKIQNFYSRLKRFKRKANLNNWNYFTTFTYDGKRIDEDYFRESLRKCLSNLSSRRGWRYMGVFERSPEKDRLHFHVLMYVPEGQMIGTIEERKEYSTKQKKMQTIFCNTFFEKRFGRNDFKPIEQQSCSKSLILNYIIKYIQKTGERIIYSRNIPETVVVPLTGDSIATWFYNFGLKFVFFDNICDWETDLSQVSAFTPVRLKTKIIEPEPILETVSMPVVEYEQSFLSI